ncbi:hypothetical protein E3O06_07400 [Cryobacterium glaciale]|uniref:Uncharacterized protein n=1 Tax=Cryobacterium glaciale TaxID=1259145 RepID=A0A4R8UXE8_9MICO|nr:hypothetical protein [Cryobacterium glaciale]TFB74132.1 hypothetical protein E3O06_07400 [Cryobacterium glaciale]
MRDSTKGYFQALREFQAALTARDYDRANVVQKRGLIELKSCLSALSAYMGTNLPPSVPFVDAQGLSIAALFNDPEVISTLELLALEPQLTDRLSITGLHQDIASVASLRQMIRTQPGITRVSAVERVKVETMTTGRRIGSLLDYMAKAEDVREDRTDGFARYWTVEKKTKRDDGLVIRTQEESFRAGCDFLLPEPVQMPLQRASPGPPHPENWIEPPGITLDLYHRLIDERGAAPKVLDSDRPLSFGENIPAEERLTGRGKAIVVANNTWILFHRRPPTSLRSHGYAHIRDAEGRLIGQLELGHDFIRVYSHRSREFVIILDSDLDVHVYRESGERIERISLRDTPEVVETVRAWNAAAAFPIKSTAAVRSIDFDPASRTFLVTVLNRVWVFSLNGDVRYCRRVAAPGASPVHWPSAGKEDISFAAEVLGLPVDITRDEMVAYAKETGLVVVGESIGFGEDAARLQPDTLSDDWIYFSWLTPDGGCVFSTYTGLTVQLDANGQTVGTWYSGTVSSCLTDADDRGGLDSGPRFHSWALTTPGWFAVHTPVLLTIASVPPTRITKQIVLPKNYTTIYPAGNRIVVETRTGRYLFDVD